MPKYGHSSAAAAAAESSGKSVRALKICSAEWCGPKLFRCATAMAAGAKIIKNAYTPNRSDRTVRCQLTHTHTHSHTLC